MAVTWQFADKCVTAVRIRGAEGDGLDRSATRTTSTDAIELGMKGPVLKYVGVARAHVRCIVAAGKRDDNASPFERRFAFRYGTLNRDQVGSRANTRYGCNRDRTSHRSLMTSIRWTSTGYDYASRGVVQQALGGAGAGMKDRNRS